MSGGGSSALSRPEFGRTFSFRPPRARWYRAICETLIARQSREKMDRKGARGFRARIRTERPCIIVRSSSPRPAGEAIYVRVCTRTRSRSRVYTYARTCWRINRTFAFPSSTSLVPRPRCLASRHDTLIGGRRVLRTGNIWWPAMAARALIFFLFFLPLSLSLCFFYFGLSCIANLCHNTQSRF